MPLSLPSDILRKSSEEVPDWIRAAPDLTASIVEKFIGSRVVFYPGAGTDSGAIRLFGSSQNSHCFVHADYSHNDCGRNPKGYRAVRRSVLSAQMLTKLLGWRDTHPVSDGGHLGRKYRLRALWVIFKRMKSFDEYHGAEYLALLHMQAEAICVFRNLWARRGRALHAVVLQDHGLGGNCTQFGRESPLYKLASDNGALPNWLLVGTENTEAWPGYRKVSKPDHPAGMHGNCSSLYLRARS